MSFTYGALSVSMIFVNKLILSAGGDMTPERMLAEQCAIAAISILILRLFIKFPVFISFKTFKLILLVNLAFIGTMLANNYTLKYLSVHMVALLKNSALVFTALGDYFFLDHQILPVTWFSLVLIIIGASLGLATDIQFSIKGYIWMSIAVIFASGYVILSKMILSKKKKHFLTIAFWNNFLSPFLLFFFHYIECKTTHRGKCDHSNGNIHQVESIYLRKPFMLFSGFLGLSLDLSTYFLLGFTTATSYVVVGAAKKIVQSLLSFIFYGKSTSLNNIISVFIGLSGSTLYTYVKYEEQAKIRDEEELQAFIIDESEID